MDIVYNLQTFTFLSVDWSGPHSSYQRSDEDDDEGHQLNMSLRFSSFRKTARVLCSGLRAG